MKLQRSGGFLMAKIRHLAGRIFTKILKDYQIEINPAQGRIMFVLWRNKGISIQELAKKTSLGKSTLTSMLDRLENKGYIKRVPSKIDRRKILIEPTEKDRSLHDKYIQVSQKMNDIFYKGFTNHEIDTFEAYLSRIFDNLAEFIG
ncbi:MAG: MarR family winged helix-turn-helix transcriptional regulator [Promethearchaeota archaeon]